MSKPIVDDIPKSERGAFLAELLEAYVDRQGLGAMPKADLDALIVHLYRKHSGAADRFDAFELSRRFKLREARLKSLVAVGELKFGSMVEGDAWCAVLATTATSRFAVESLEKGQIRFKLDNPALFPYLQSRIRGLGATASYASRSEEVKLDLTVFLEILDQIHGASQSDFSTHKHLDRVRHDIDRTLKQLGASLGRKRLKALKGEESVLSEALDTGAKLGSIGKLILAIIG